MSGFQTRLLEGLAAWTAAAGIGITYRASGSYNDLETAVVLRKLAQKPDRMVTLTAFPVTDEAMLSDSRIGVQVRCRWNGEDPRGADDLADAIFDLWHGRTGLTLGTGVRITQIVRASQAPLPQDESGRWAVSANYYVTVHRPSPNRT